MSESAVPLIQTIGLRKHYPGVIALQDVDFDLRPSEVHALVGKNGAGKSTLIKILSGAITPDEGEVRINGNVVHLHNPREAFKQGIATINQELMLVSQLSIAENILLGQLPQKQLGRVDWPKANSLARESLSVLGLELDPTLAVETLSVAEQQVTEIARALSREAGIIIMDEPTAALPKTEVDKLLAYVKKLCEQGKSVIYVTHKLDEVFRIADRITVLRDGCKVATVRKEETTPAEVVNLMVGRGASAIFLKEKVEVGSLILEVRHLSREGILDDISFKLHRGEILGLAGAVGSGRTELVRAIFGADPIDSGEIWVDGERIEKPSIEKMISTGVGMTPEDRKQHGLVLEMNVADNLMLSALRKLTKWHLRNRRKEQEISASLFSDLSIAAPSLNAEVFSLSGGNQQKVVVGKWLATEPRILILDEPTRGIDIRAKAEIHALVQQLAKQGVAILFISSELEEVLSVCNKIIVMFEGRVVGQFDSDAVAEETIMAYASGQAG